MAETLTFIIKPSIGMFYPLKEVMHTRGILTLERNNSLTVTMDVVEMYFEGKIGREQLERSMTNIPISLDTSILSDLSRLSYKLPNNPGICNLVHVICVLAEYGHYGGFSYLIDYLQRNNYKTSRSLKNKIKVSVQKCTHDVSRVFMLDFLERRGF